MHVQALSVGIEVPTHCFSGTVHSVFGQACNLGIEPDGLLTLLHYQKGNTPHGIRLNAVYQSVFPDLLRAGQPVACRGGIIRIDNVDLSVDLRGARRWHANLRELHIDLRQPAQAQSLAAAWSALKASHRRSGLSEIMQVFSLPDEQHATSAVSKVLLDWSTHSIPALLRATSDFHLDDAMTSIESVIGLGPGLTPSGDDFLVGHLAGLWCTAGNNPSRMRFLTALGPELLQAARHTNEISCAHLRSAVKGNFSEPIATLVQQLKQSNNMNSVRAATQAALQAGHTSGSDGVLGLLLGCIAWQHPPLYLISGGLLHSLVHRYSTAQR